MRGVARGRCRRPQPGLPARDECQTLEVAGRLAQARRSSFDLRAYSKAGAAGIWQFIPATGRRFMRVDALVDERRDPFASTRAAALYLREVHGPLNSWPLSAATRRSRRSISSLPCSTSPRA